MIHRNFLYPALLFWLGTTYCFAADQRSIPAFTAPVIDEAGLLDAAEKQELSSLLDQIQQHSGMQLAILIVSSLDGEPLESFSIRVATEWKLGTATQDNGVLITVVSQEKKIRIEVGQGLEGDITDAHSKRLIDQVVVPEFRQQNFYKGLYQLAIELVQLARPQTINDLQLNNIESQSSHAGDSSNMSTKGYSPRLIFFIIILFLLLTPFGRTFLLAILWSAMASQSSGYRRSGGGGGGFSGGGGGGFSGGGASGGW